MKKLTSSAIILLAILASTLTLQAQTDTRTFPETGFTVKGKFLKYWNEHGGLAQQGFPVSNEFQEKSEADGKTYTVQYFERSVFELHTENQPPYDILLTQLGTLRLKQKYPNGTGNTTPVPSQPTTRPVSGPLVQLGNYTAYKLTATSVVVVGVISNTGTVPASNLNVSCDLLDVSGGVAATGRDQVLSFVTLDPGKQAGFYCYIGSPPATWAKVEAQVSATPYDPSGFHLYKPANASLTITADTLAKDTYVGWHVRGKLTNTATTPLQFAKVIATGYDANGNIVDVQSGFAGEGDLAPGAAAPFDAHLIRSDTTITRYTLYPTASEASK